MTRPPMVMTDDSVPVTPIVLTVEIPERPYPVVLGNGVASVDRDTLLHSAGLDETRPVLVLTDSNLHALHSTLLRDWSDGADPVIVEAGEKTKTMSALEGVLQALVEAGATRDHVLLAFGGGVVGDLAGMAASLCLRGLDLVHVPTSLLAQVDSSVGGKTAVNLEGGKNLAGTYHQPCAVLVDPALLDTLPDEEWRCGMGEVVKYGLLEGGDLLKHLETSASDILRRTPAVVLETVRRCLMHKVAVVSRDERDLGERRHLNLGHTVGHALEYALQGPQGRISHGEAVGLGLRVVVAMSEDLGLLGDHDLGHRLESIMDSFELPTTWSLPGSSEIMNYIGRDKKRRAGQALTFVLLEGAGHPVVRNDVSEDLVLRGLGIIEDSTD